MKISLIIFLLLLMINLSFGQNENKFSQDSTSWENLRTSAHQIGFCIYHSSKDHCTDHSNEFAKREKETPKDYDPYYFEMKKEWAQSRLDEWEKRQNQSVNNFLILYDIAQVFSFEKTKPETYNLFRGFILINLTNSIEFIFSKKNKSTMTIKSKNKNALMENTLWREFMTGRLGRFSEKIEFSLIGVNTESDFEKFKEAFSNFQKKFK